MKHSPSYGQLIRILGFLPLKRSFYRLAFVPKSASIAMGGNEILNNERLEFLGDAIIDAIVAEYLYMIYPGEDEGFLTKLRSRIVKRKTLNNLAKEIGLHTMIRPSGSGGNRSKHVYGNALEALVGAIYLDRGYGKARKFFLKKIMLKHLDLDQLARKDPDYKSRIIEWAQKNRVEIIYNSKEMLNPVHRKPLFISELILDGQLRGKGQGSAKKDAEQRASREAMDSLHTSSHGS